MTMALGDQLGQDTGQITTTRVLPPSARGDSRMEVTFEARGRLLDQDVTDLGTYVAVVGSDGVLHGQGHGVTMTGDGHSATWNGTGVGRFTGRGSATSWRGVVYYQTASETLARLNGVAVLFEHEEDESGKSETKYYEWK